MTIEFKQCDTTNYKQRNDGFFNKLSKLGFTLNSDLPKISSPAMETFLNANYYDILPVIPVASCSFVAGNKNLIARLREEFGIKASTVYGYIKTEDKFFHKFSDSDLNKAVQQKQYFKNHHAWIMFENGQLLDLTFVNTLKAANDINEEVFEFILSDGDNVDVPKALTIIKAVNSRSFFNYIPMYYGNLFSDELLFKVAQKGVVF